MAVQTQILHRRDTAANWTAANPILGGGELGFETDTNKFKIGNGSTVWASLNYFVSSASPTFTGTPLSTTAAVDTNTTQIATTAYVVGQGYAKLASPTFTGTPTLPNGTIGATQIAGNSSTALATTAFVTTADNLKANLASPTFTGVVQIPNVKFGYSTTVTAAGTTTLVNTSDYNQFFTGTTTQTVVLPVASTMVVGQIFFIHNNSTGSLTVNSSGGNLVATIGALNTAQITCILASGTTAASWDTTSFGPTISTSLPSGGNDGNTWMVYS